MPKIYNKTITMTSRIGRQYNNTCEGCNELACLELLIVHPCARYPAMDNMVRCIDYNVPKKMEVN